MAKKSEISKERDRILMEMNEMSSDADSSHNISNHLANVDDVLPSLGELQIYDYDQDEKELSEIAKDTIREMVNLYLGDVPAVIDIPYIQKKIEDDANNYKNALFLTKMTQKAYISIQKQIDSGSAPAKIFEVLNQTAAQMRENIKFATEQKSKLETFYKNIRADIGLDSQVTPKETETVNDSMRDNTSDLIFDEDAEAQPIQKEEGSVTVMSATDLLNKIRNAKK